MRRLAIGLVLVGAALAGVTGDRGGAASAQTVSTTPTTAAAGADAGAGSGASDRGSQLVVAPPVDAVKVSGYIDPIIADFLEQAIADAETDGAQGLILQLNSRGAVVSRARIAKLAERMAASTVPITIWVGPSGARALGLAGQLLGYADRSAIAAGARVGKFGVDIVVPGRTSTIPQEARTRLRGRTVGAKDAISLGAVNLADQEVEMVTVQNVLASLDGFTKGDVQMHTVRATTTDKGEDRRELIATLRFADLAATQRLMHTVASPPVAYLLLTIGLMLLLFEFFTAGVGVAGSVGAICVLLGCYGVAALPARGWAVALIVVSVLAFAVDVQTGVPRLWTVVGVIAYVVGAVWLYEDLTLSWITLLAGIGGTLLAVLAGMPAMVRTRFATPTIGRESMIGEVCEAVSAVAPDGLVRVRGAQWKAHTNRATPLVAGAAVRVVGIDRTVLEVEPIEGGARDYRERRPKTSASGADAHAEGR